MEIKLTKEQLAYLKSLVSKKKKRKFLLDCLVESIEVENNEIKLDEFLKNCVFKKWEYLVEKPLGEEIKIDTDLKNESESEKIKFVYEHFDHLLEIIKTAEIAEILKTICVKQQDYQYASKFRELEKKFREKEELIAKSNEPQPPMEFCVEITDENRGVLQEIWSKRGQAVVGNYLITNSLNTYLMQNTEPFLEVENFGKKELPIVTTDEFLKYIGREDLIEKKVVERCEICYMFPKIEGSNKCESCHSCVKHFIETSPEFAKYRPKSNYSPEEIELVKHNINQREVTEQGSELLKFDKLEIQEDKDIKSHEYCNNIINFSNLIVKCMNMQSDPTNILNQFLLSVNKYYYYKTKNTIDFIDELFPQLKNNEIAK